MSSTAPSKGDRSLSTFDHDYFYIKPSTQEVYRRFGTPHGPDEGLLAFTATVALTEGPPAGFGTFRRATLTVTARSWPDVNMPTYAVDPKHPKVSPIGPAGPYGTFVQLFEAVRNMSGDQNTWPAVVHLAQTVRNDWTQADVQAAWSAPSDDDRPPLLWPYVSQKRSDPTFNSRVTASVPPPIWTKDLTGDLVHWSTDAGSSTDLNDLWALKIVYGLMMAMRDPHQPSVAKNPFV